MPQATRSSGSECGHRSGSLEGPVGGSVVETEGQERRIRRRGAGPKPSGAPLAHGRG